MSGSIRSFLIILLLSSIHSLSIDAQNLVNRKGKELPITVFAAKDDSFSIQDIVEGKVTFNPTDHFQRKSKPSETYWIQIDFKNEVQSLAQDSLWYLRLRSFEYASLFYDDNGTIEERPFGSIEHSVKDKSIIYSSGVPFKSKSLIDKRFLYLKIKRVGHFENINDWRISYTSQLTNDLIKGFYSNRDLDRLKFMYIFAGICIVMFILTFTFYLYSKRKEFLFYTLYVLFLILYLTSSVLNLHGFLFGNLELLDYAIFESYQVLINLSYVLFVIYYLDTKTVYPKLHVALKIIAYVLSLIIILDLIFIVTKFFIGHIYLLDFQRIVMTIFGLIGMSYLLIKGKNKLTYFIVIGSFLYMAGALGLLFFGQRLFMIIGSSLEILIFASGLSYKIQLEHIEKLRFQKESMINKTKALRAQINPHFIFNSLGSIQHLIINKKNASAIKYLSKFSGLMRGVLETSLENNVTLSEEITLLTKYLELESLRFEENFSYAINVHPNLDPLSVEVPGLLVQPFVENAILHGFMNKKNGEKILSIDFKLDDSILICTIDDTGIGRKASSEIKSILKRNSTSRGIEVTKKRLNELNDPDVKNIKFIDKVDAEGNALGTQVIINISIEN